jgi:hypothetical protein
LTQWWRDGKELTEGHFTRALRSLERRGFLFRQQAPGCHPSWIITPEGRAAVLIHDRTPAPGTRI